MAQMIIDLLLNDWKFLNNQLSSLTVEQLRDLINAEIQGKNRRTFIERIHQRYAKLMTMHERAALLEGVML